MSGFQAGPRGPRPLRPAACADARRTLVWTSMKSSKPRRQPKRGLDLIATLIDPKKRGQVGTRSIACPAAYVELSSEVAVDY